MKNLYGRIFIRKWWKYARETFSISTVSVSGSLLESKCSLENKSHHSSAKLWLLESILFFQIYQMTISLLQYDEYYSPGIQMNQNLEFVSRFQHVLLLYPETLLFYQILIKDGNQEELW